MTDHKCQGCAHWKPATEVDTEIRLGLGDCDYPVLFWDATEWQKGSEHRELKPEFKDKKAFVQDGSDYWARLITHAYFGCNQWTSK